MSYGPFSPKLQSYDDTETLSNTEVAELFGWTVAFLKRMYLDGSHGFPSPAKQGRKRLHSVAALRAWAASYDKMQGWT